MNGKMMSKESKMKTLQVNKDYTKISIAKDLHELVKRICDEKGLKMYHFENKAVENYIKDNFPEYLNGHKE
jgi:hypothetical protein